MELFYDWKCHKKINSLCTISRPIPSRGHFDIHIGSNLFGIKWKKKWYEEQMQTKANEAVKWQRNRSFWIFNCNDHWSAVRGRRIATLFNIFFLLVGRREREREKTGLSTNKTRHSCSENGRTKNTRKMKILAMWNCRVVLSLFRWNCVSHLIASPLCRVECVCACGWIAESCYKVTNYELRTTKFRDKQRGELDICRILVLATIHSVHNPPISML